MGFSIIDRHFALNLGRYVKLFCVRAGDIEHKGKKKEKKKGMKAGLVDYSARARPKSQDHALITAWPRLIILKPGGLIASR